MYIFFFNLLLSVADLPALSLLEDGVLHLPQILKVSLTIYKYLFLPLTPPKLS
jgi:hypothetical protein